MPTQYCEATATFSYIIGMSLDLPEVCKHFLCSGLVGDVPLDLGRLLHPHPKPNPTTTPSLHFHHRDTYPAHLLACNARTLNGKDQPRGLALPATSTRLH